MRKRMLALACSLAVAGMGTAHGQDVGALKTQMETLQRQLDAVKAQLDKVTAQVQQQGAAPAPAGGAEFVRLKPDAGLTFAIGQSEVQLYGHADLSVDEMSNGLDGRTGAVGKMGWLSQVSSNLSYFGVRGNRPIGGGLKALFQFETEVAYSSTPGPTSDASVKQGLGSRNSYVGLSGNWGAVKVGKTDAPYKTSTARMDPFSATVGDYNSIIGNSGGDNRAEFDTRVPHAIWYESPNMSGVRFGLLVSPGQNRSNDNSITARGEPTCTGGNQPPCGDGSFGTLWSAAVSYTSGPLYLIAGYEHHKDVNRTGDEGGAVDGTPPPGGVGIADESAWKIGGQFKIQSTGTTINAIFERLKRNAPIDAFNERTRHTATWLALTQKLTPMDELNIGWAHAGRTPGDPGAAINSFTSTDNNSGPVDNQSNMYAIGLKHHFSDNHTTVYLVGAEQKNHSGAHYDLGASGHGVVVDCKDSTGACFAGATLKAVSLGMTYDF